jgi:hypothetical protein
MVVSKNTKRAKFTETGGLPSLEGPVVVEEKEPVVDEIKPVEVTIEEENKIIGLLEKEDTKDLIHDIALAPVWIQKIMKRALEIEENK